MDNEFRVTAQELPGAIESLLFVSGDPISVDKLSELLNVKKAAVEEASAAGKQQIDLIDGEEFITKLAEFGIGVREVKDYEIDEDYFAKI